MKHSSPTLEHVCMHRGFIDVIGICYWEVIVMEFVKFVHFAAYGSGG